VDDDLSAVYEYLIGSQWESPGFRRGRCPRAGGRRPPL